MNKYEFHITVEPSQRIDIRFPSKESIESTIAALGLKLYHIANYRADGTEINREFITGYRAEFETDHKARDYLFVLAALLQDNGLLVTRTKLETPRSDYVKPGVPQRLTLPVTYWESHYKLAWSEELSPAQIAAVCMKAAAIGLAVSRRLNSPAGPLGTQLLLTERTLADTFGGVDSPSFPQIVHTEHEVCLWDSAEWLDDRWLGRAA